MAAERIPGSNPEEILWERFRYLLAYHGVGVQHGNCEECKNLMVIRTLLLKPFAEVA